MKFALASALLASAALAIEAQDIDFINFVAKHGKSYKSLEEYAKRAELFKNTVHFINEHNAVERTYKLGVNLFSDWTDAEYSKLLGYKPGNRNSEAKIVKYSPYVLPTTVDWIAAGAVTPVKNQGSCGSCWTFSTTGALEGANFIASGTLLSFSEQQLIDCDPQNNGCGGGDSFLAYEYFQSSYVETETQYPYVGANGVCQYNSTSNTGVLVTDWTTVTPRDAEQMKAALAEAPLSVNLDASAVFKSYTSGVFADPLCGNQHNHAVLAVGYGVDSDGTEYWVVKNSWGTGWGEGGYIRMAIVEGDGICGVQMHPLKPVVNI